MKYEVLHKNYSDIPIKCKHEFRLYGSHINEEVWIPVGRINSKEGWVICDKCGWNPYAEEYRVIGKKPYYPFGENKIDDKYSIPWHHTMVELIKTKEIAPHDYIQESYYYEKPTKWKRFKKWLYDVCDTIGIAGSFGGFNL